MANYRKVLEVLSADLNDVDSPFTIRSTCSTNTVSADPFNFW